MKSNFTTSHRKKAMFAYELRFHHLSICTRVASKIALAPPASTTAAPSTAPKF